MFTVIRELVSHLIGKGFGEVELVLGVPLAFSFWCLQYSIATWRVRRGESVVLLLAASAIITLLMLLGSDPGTFVRIVLAGGLFYAPLYWHALLARGGGARERGKRLVRADAAKERARGTDEVS